MEEDALRVLEFYKSDDYLKFIKLKNKQIKNPKSLSKKEKEFVSYIENSDIMKTKNAPWILLLAQIFSNSMFY